MFTPDRSAIRICAFIKEHDGTFTEGFFEDMGVEIDVAAVPGPAATPSGDAEELISPAEVTEMTGVTGQTRSAGRVRGAR